MALAGAVDPEERASDAVLRDAYANTALQTGLANPLDEALVAAGRARALALPDGSTRSRSTSAGYGSACWRRGLAGPLLVTKGAVSEVFGVCTTTRAAPLDANRPRGA